MFFQAPVLSAYLELALSVSLTFLCNPEHHWANSAQYDREERSRRLL